MKQREKNTRRDGLASAVFVWVLVSFLSIVYSMEATMSVGIFGNRVETQNWVLMGLWLGCLVWVDVRLYQTENRRATGLFLTYWGLCTALVLGSVLAGQLSPQSWWFLRLTPLIHLIPLWNLDRTWDWPWNGVQWGMMVMMGGHVVFCLWQLLRCGKKPAEEE